MSSMLCHMVPPPAYKHTWASMSLITGASSSRVNTPCLIKKPSWKNCFIYANMSCQKLCSKKGLSTLIHMYIPLLGIKVPLYTIHWPSRQATRAPSTRLIAFAAWPSAAGNSFSCCCFLVVNFQVEPPVTVVMMEKIKRRWWRRDKSWVACLAEKVGARTQAIHGRK